MKTTKANYWWLPLLMSIFLIVVSIIVFFKPLEAFLGLAYLFVAALLVSGAFNITFSVANRKTIDTWWWFLINGLLEFIVGILMLIKPAATVIGLILYVGFWLAFKSMMSINYSFELKKLGFKDWWLNLLGAFLTLIFAFMMIMDPEFGMWGVVFLTGTSLLLTGLFGFYLSMQLRSFQKRFSN